MVVDTPLFLVLLFPCCWGRDGNSHDQICSFNRNSAPFPPFSKGKRHLKTTSWMLDFRLRHGSFLLILCKFWNSRIQNEKLRLLDLETQDCLRFFFKGRSYRLWDIVGIYGAVISLTPWKMKCIFFDGKKQYRSYIITPYHEEVSSPFNCFISILMDCS